MKDGYTVVVLTRSSTPSVYSSLANAPISPRTPYLEAAYAIIRSIGRLTQRCESRLISITFFRSSGVPSRKDINGSTPALFTRMSTGPSFKLTSFFISLTAWYEETSACREELRFYAELSNVGHRLLATVGVQIDHGNVTSCLGQLQTDVASESVRTTGHQRRPAGNILFGCTTNQPDDGADRQRHQQHEERQHVQQNRGEELHQVERGRFRPGQRRSSAWRLLDTGDDLLGDLLGREDVDPLQHRQQASIIDQHIDGAQLGLDGEPQPVHLLAAGDVRQERFRLHAELAHVLGGSLRARQVDVDHGHLATFAGQPQTERPTETVRSAGHESRLAADRLLLRRQHEPHQPLEEQRHQPDEELQHIRDHVAHHELQ
uniref:Uncharacterized protein n=1 Tax=Anopheles atroparvus TaxID=41427 RepID=A0A182INS5_ANOAO